MVGVQGEWGVPTHEEVAAGGRDQGSDEAHQVIVHVACGEWGGRKCGLWCACFNVKVIRKTMRPTKLLFM